MPTETCFVIMPIGDQHVGDKTVSGADLRRRYDDLIKEALARAAPGLDITRADDFAHSGSITTEIITRLMHSTFVVADVTFPNPNVYYELGLRHACRVGTLIIRDRDGPKVPFDIAHLRHIEYQNTPTGLRELSDRFRAFFDHFARNQTRPDSQFQELAQLMKFKFPDYAPPEASLEADIMMGVLRSPKLLDLLMQSGRGEKLDQSELLMVMAENPDIAKLFITGLKASGQMNLFPRPGSDGGAAGA